MKTSTESNYDSFLQKDILTFVCLVFFVVQKSA